MSGNAALEMTTATANNGADELRDPWFDAPPPSAVRPRTFASEPPASRRSLAPPGETEIDPLADAWFR